MLSKKNNKQKVVLATLALMLLSFSMASWMVISTPNYASAQQVTGQGGSNATSATNATVTGAGNATNATTTGDAGTTAGNQTVGGPLALYGGGGGQ